MKCIFCKSISGPFNTREHILPESLGGGDWAILPGGLFCDHCQNRFGSSIEQQALADYPFSLFRVLMGIPTKKGKAPWLKSWEGIITGDPQLGVLGYEPSPIFKDAVEERRKTEMRILAHPLKPAMVCRTLLKMGVEIVAADGSNAVFDSKFDAARTYALLGQKKGSWWYLQHEDITAISRYLKEGITLEEYAAKIELETILIEDTAEVFHLKLLYLDLFTPLDPRIQPPPEGSLQEPEYRLFVV
ncbi:MAG: hypothetical protein QOF02_3666 [Blastocatellia bacterium]|jgi:hypothetical protein|nr:hypothetical protein [Blastocatellia bacterium]